MKNLVYITALFVSCQAFASEVLIQSPSTAGFDGFAADGETLLETAGLTYTFFPAVFDEALDDLDWLEVANEWGAAVATWGKTGPTAGRFNGQNGLTDNSTDGGLQAAIVGFGKNGANDILEFWVGTNAEWVFPAFNELDVDVTDSTWNVADAGTISVVGSLDLGASTPFLTFETVPEPSTYLLMAIGLGGVYTVYRRKQKQA